MRARPPYSDPLSGQPFPDRIVPQSRASENGPRLLKPCRGGGTQHDSYRPQPGLVGDRARRYRPHRSELGARVGDRVNTTVRFDNNGNPTEGFGAVNAAGPARVLSFGLKLLF